MDLPKKPSWKQTSEEKPVLCSAAKHIDTFGTRCFLF